MREYRLQRSNGGVWRVQTGYMSDAGMLWNTEIETPNEEEARVELTKIIDRNRLEAEYNALRKNWKTIERG